MDCHETTIGRMLRDLSNRLFDGYEAIGEACCKAGNALLGEAGRIASIATRT